MKIEKYFENMIYLYVLYIIEVIIKLNILILYFLDYLKYIC